MSNDKLTIQPADLRQSDGARQVLSESAFDGRPIVQRVAATTGGDNAPFIVMPQIGRVAPVSDPVPTKTNVNDAELAKIPGFTQIQQAELIMQNQSLSLPERIAKAGPLYERGVEESKKIDVAKLDQHLAAIGTRMKTIEEGLDKVKTDPAALQKYVQQHDAEYGQLTADANVLKVPREMPSLIRMRAAVAYNNAAAEMYAQAGKDPAKKDELTQAADQLNRRAADTLRSLEQVDPRMWNEKPAIKGAIHQAEQHQLIDPSAANAVGQVINLKDKVDFGVNGPFKVAQPLWMSLNGAGQAFEIAGKIPVAGPVLEAWGGGLAPASWSREDAAKALANAKNQDETATNATVAQFRHQMANQGEQVVADIASGYAGLAAGRVVVNALGNKLGPVGKVLTFAGVGMATTTAANASIDWASSKVFGTEQRKATDLLTHSAASFAATWGLQSAANYKNVAKVNALGAVEGRPSFAQSMAVWNEQPSLAINRAKISFNGTQVDIPVKLSKDWLSLNPAGRQAVGDVMKSKFTANQFAALGDAEKYQAFLNAYGAATKTAAAELAGGKLMAKLPFSGSTAAARAQLGELEAPMMFTRKGKLAWGFGTGAGSMGVYGLGEVNPLLTNEKGENYTLKDTVMHAGSNMLWGGLGSSLVAPAVGKTMEMVATPITKPAAWLFNSEAAALAKPWAGLAQTETRSFGEIAKSFTGKWAISGENALAAGGSRFIAGSVGAGGLGFITHNPLVDSQYTWADAGDHALKWGAIGGTSAVAAPYLMFGVKAGIEKTGRPLYNWTVAPIVNHTAVPVYNKIQPGLTSMRAFLGRQSDTVLANPVSEAVQSGWKRYAETSLGPTAMLEAQGAGALYGNYHWKRLNEDADAIMAAARQNEKRR